MRGPRGLSVVCFLWIACVVRMASVAEAFSVTVTMMDTPSLRLSSFSGESITRIWASPGDDDNSLDAKSEKHSINKDPLQLGPSPDGVVPLTPCNRICRYNANVFDGQVCIGCFRETFEIAAWSSMSPSEKSFALMDAMDRLDSVVVADGDGDEAVVNGAVTREDLQRQANYWNQQAKVL